MSAAERLPQDHAARAAALDPSRSFLVQAPAGSGKTELLTDRILALLATVDRPEEIVAITFTRKAASEMHARVLSKLRAGAGPMPALMHEQRSWQLARAALARDEEKKWHLLTHPARLGIRTIDSFCAGLVRSMPWLSELGGMPQITDHARTHYEAAAQATLDLIDEFDAARQLLAHLDVDLLAARDAIADMLGQRDQWLPLLAHGSDRARMEADLAAAIREDLQAVSAEMPVGWFEAISASARLAAAQLHTTGGDNVLSALLDWTEALQPEARDLPAWRALSHLLLTASGTLRKTVNKNLGFPPGCAYKAPFIAWLESVQEGTWTHRLAALRDIPNPAFSDQQWQVLVAQLMTLKLAVAQLRLRFAATGEVDFIEISQRAALALGSAEDPGELLLKLDASIRHLLIDEFQDTSQTQLELLRLLTSGWQAGDGRSLFLVGDPMQSIYRFRKAEVGLFLEVAAQGLGTLQLEFLNLTDNFRSQGGIVDWVNRSFAQLLPPRNDAAAGAIAYSPSAAFHATLPGEAVFFHPVWSGVEYEAVEAQAEAIVVDIVRQALHAHQDASHPVAILVRARSHLAQLTRRLAQEGIACRAVDLVPLALRPVVADLVQLVRALSHPADRLAWLSVLRAPFCGLTLTSLQSLFGADHQTPIPVLLTRALRPAPLTDDAEDAARPPVAQAVLSADEYARLLPMAEVLLDHTNASGSMPFAAWIENVWRRLGGPALYAGASVMQDAESLFRLIERLAPYGAMDMAALEAGMADLYAAPDTQDEAAGVVEIMTMHKAKGLQFESVILYGLHRAPRGDQAPLVRIEQVAGRVLFGPIKPRADTEADPLSRYLGAREARRAAYETDRLLYVAATRARKQLHLIGHLAVDTEHDTPKPPPSASLLGRLWPCLPVPTVPPGRAPVEPEIEAAFEWQGEPLRRLAAQGLVERMERTAQVAVKGATSTVDRRRAEPPGWQLDSGDEAAIGTLAHAWLERLGRDGLAAWSAQTLTQHLPVMRRQLTRAGVPDRQADAAAQAVLDTLQSTLADPRGQWLLSQSSARREWPLMDATGKVSVIDLALSTEAGWLIVDYKTSRPGPDESAADFAARMKQRYADQLQRYCTQVTALDQRPARAALYFPRVRMWVEL